MSPEGLTLADTSVWVEFLRRGSSGRAARLDSLLEAESVVVCGPVVAELIAGARDSDRDRLWRLLHGLPWAEIDRTGWNEVGRAAAELRARGDAVALTDIEIGVAASRAGASVWSGDPDFERVASVVPELVVLPLE